MNTLLAICFAVLGRLHDTWKTLCGRPIKHWLVDLTTREGWEIACALRGPDLHMPAVKMVLTNRIRYLVLKKVGQHRQSHEYPTRKFNVSEVTAAGFLGQIDALRVSTNADGTFGTSFGSSLGFVHYLQHISTAAKVLGDYNLARLATLATSRFWGTQEIVDVWSVDVLNIETVMALAGGRK